MGNHIDKTFALHAPLERVWAFLVNPRDLVSCLPGAQLVEVVDDRNFVGNIKVKVGPVLAVYKGRVRVLEIQPSARLLRMSGEGRDSGGAGSAKMTMQSVLSALPDGQTQVVVSADVDVAGRLAQLGRGMVDQVANELFEQFSKALRSRLEARPGGRAGVAPGKGPAERDLVVRPVSALSLLFKAVMMSIGRFLARLFGRNRS